MIDSLKIKSPLKIIKLETGLIFQSGNKGLCLVVGFPPVDCVMRLIDWPEAFTEGYRAKSFASLWK